MFFLYLSFYLSGDKYRYFSTASDKKPVNKSWAQISAPVKSPTDLKTPRRLVWLRLSEIKDREVHFPFSICDLTFVIDHCPKSDLEYGAEVNMTISDATPRHTPKGSGGLNPCLQRYIRIAPTMAPMIERRSRPPNAPIQPMKAPTTDIIFTSPSPIPSIPRMKK